MKPLFYVLIFLTFFVESQAQVGINTDTPDQALDVEGKIEVGDDATTPTEGSIRYNTSEDDFEGFDGSVWNSFTESSSGIPANAQFVTTDRDFDNNSSAQPMEFQFIDNSIAFVGAVPTGKYLLVTGIVISPVSLFDIDTEEPFYSVSLDFGPTDISVRGKYTDGVIFQEQAAYAPIAIVRPGTTPRVTNFSLVSELEQFDQGVNVTITGFLVDDVNFN